MRRRPVDTLVKRVDEMEQVVRKKDREIHKNVTYRIKTGWLKRKVGKIPLKLKGKFYRTTIRPVLLYGSECCAVKYQHE